MAEMITITVNGKEVTVAKDSSLLAACRQARIDIPTMCYNENVKAYGVCRLCVVEVDDGWRKRIVPSCVYPVRKAVTVQTETEEIRKYRRMLLNLQLARCPNEPFVQELAAKYGINEPDPRLKRDDNDCILCGLCVRTCSDIVGVHAIAFEGRGENRVVVTPFNEENELCIACGACAFVCPTQCIGFKDENGERELKRWHRKTKMIACEKCGDYWLPEALRDVYAKKMGLDPAIMNVCSNCR